MEFLESLNTLKDQINETEKLIENLQIDLRKGAKSDIESIRKIINQLGSSIEKKIKDQEINEKLKQEIQRNMEKSGLYTNLTQEDRLEISNMVLESADKELLDLEELIAFHVKFLRKLSPADLVHFMYSKKDILEFGRGIVSKDLSDEVAYQAAYEVLENNSKIPSKRESMIGDAVRIFRKDKNLQNEALKNYYGI
jgi:hypothetical protein